MQESRIRQLVRDVCLRAADGGLITAARVEDWIGELLSAGQIERVTGGLQCTSGHAFQAFRQALLNGSLRDWRRPLLALLELDAERRFQYSLPFTRLVALTRVFLCGDLHEQPRRELQRLYRPILRRAMPSTGRSVARGRTVYLQSSSTELASRCCGRVEPGRTSVRCSSVM